MLYLLALFLFGLMVGAVAVASSPTPCYAAIGLVFAAGFGCALLAEHGGSFLSLVLFLIYLGGMLVVFAYSAALASEPFPVAWGDREVMMYAVVYMLGVMLLGGWLGEEWYGISWLVVDEYKDFEVGRGDVGGVAFLFMFGAGMLMGCAWVLLLALVVVLELTRGMSRGALRTAH